MKKIKWMFLAALMLPFCARAEEATLDLAATFSLGYDSRYVLYGYRLSRHLWHADLGLYAPLSETVSVWGGAWYGYLTDGTYREADVYGGLDRALTDTVSVGLAYSLFNYMEVPFPASSQSHEVAAHVTYLQERFSLTTRAQYDTDGSGFLLRGVGALTQPVNDRVTLALSAEAGYSLHYFVSGNRWNHALFKLALPIAVTDSVSCRLFVARSVPLSAIRDFEEYETYGGLSVSWSM